MLSDKIGVNWGSVYSNDTARRMMILLDPELEPDPAPREQRISAPALAQFLARAQIAARLHGEVSVLLTTDHAIRRLNRQYRGKNKPTDVLSFPADPFQNQERIAGDIAISVETARRQSAAQRHSLTSELKILILHGLLHLAGYDHESDSGLMAKRERQLRAKFRLPLGLIERALTERSIRPRGCPTAGGRP